MWFAVIHIIRLKLSIFIPIVFIMADTADRDRRRHHRSEFAYLIAIKIFSQHTSGIVFSGYVDNMSTSGACIIIEDRYGRANPEELRGSKVKITIRIPESENISLIALTRWIKRDRNNSFAIMMGIEFENVEDWQLEKIKKIVVMKNKDQTMMWNLWEQYEKKL